MNATPQAWDRAHDARAAFRACLRALSFPGSPQADLPRPGLSPDPALDGAGAVLLALLDDGLGLGVSGGPEAEELAARVCELSGAGGSELAEADFVLAGPDAEPGLAQRLRRGTALEPHRGATAVYAGTDASPSGVRLRGPGVPGEKRARLPLPGEELASLRAANAEPPVGVDALIVDRRGLLLGLPRSVEAG